MKWRFLAAVCMFLASVSVVYAGTDDIGKTLMDHVADGQAWRPLPFFGEIVLGDFHIFGLRIPFTRHALTLCMSAGILSVSCITAFGGKQIIPRGLGGILEPVALFVRDSLVYPAMGEKEGEKWLPFMETLFFFILISNLLGMLPVFPTITSSISVTIALATMVFVCVLGYGIMMMGPIGFFTNMVPDGIAKPISVMLLGIEIFGLLIRNTVLAIRLFANMMAGHIVILSLLALILIVHPVVAIISVPMALFVSLLELLVAFIQAMVFTLLATLFVAAASSHH